MNLPPSTGFGFTSSQSSPDFIDFNSTEKSQRTNNTQLKQGNPVTPGVILSKDSIEIPLEVAFGINNDKTNSSRPTLLPLFRTRYVEDRSTEDLSLIFYQERLSSIPLELQQKLNLEKSKPLEDRDPDLVALDESLRFEANLLALADGLSVPSSDEILIRAQAFLALPNMVKHELLTYGLAVTNFLDRYLVSIGPNDPSYDLLLNVSNQLKEATSLLNLKVEG
jgi:hypothetical protein